MANVPKLTRRNGKLQEEIEYLFSLLDAATTQLDEVAADFEQQLKKLD